MFHLCAHYTRDIVDLVCTTFSCLDESTLQCRGYILVMVYSNMVPGDHQIEDCSINKCDTVTLVYN